jgi:UDP-galactopyranose mutase
MKPQHLICFSHLRWNFVYQRPQHIMTRLSNYMKVTYIEEPIYDAAEPHYALNEISDSLTVVIPHLPTNTSGETEQLEQLLLGYIKTTQIEDMVLWYYTPMALEFSRAIKPGMIVYDCMDELSAFKFAPAKLQDLETELFMRADLVFTGGHSLYEEKKNYHSAIFPFPSSIEKEHFAKARSNKYVPHDQQMIDGIKLGFFGVIDERFDIELIRELAQKRPSWQIILLGPVVKIDPTTLPREENIHYLGQKTYQELPSYLSGWDIALIPFMLNESTRFISPTKTPEYLAAGIPVISTPIRDVVDPYGREKLVWICSNADELIEAAEIELSKKDKSLWLLDVDAFLSDMSWDKTTWTMFSLIRNTWDQKFKIPSKTAYV